MTRREQILVALAGAAAVVAGFLLLPGEPSGSGEMPADRGELAAMVATMQKSIGQAALSERERYVLQRSREAWAGNPFTGQDRGGEAVLEERPPFIYSGFIGSGSTTMAIIDGRQYRMGDTIGGSGYVIKRILPTTVVVGHAEADSDLAIPLGEGQ